MSEYQPVSALGNGGEGAAKEGAVSTSADAAAKPGLWARITDKAPFLQTKKGIAITVAVVLVVIGGGLSGLAVLRNRGGGGSGGRGNGGGNGGAGLVHSDEVFYGLSPAVYPSRECFGAVQGPAGRVADAGG